MGIIILIVIVYVVLKWFFTIKEGNVVLIFANIGAGKTTLLSRYAQRELALMKKGKSQYKTIISNTPISGCVYVPNIRDLLKSTTPEYALILVDEAGIVWNNRKMRISDEEIEYIKLIRHYHSKLIAISQSYDDVDITIRRIYTSMYLLNKLPLVTLVRPIKKYVTIEQETEQIIDGYKFRIFFSWGILYRPKYYQYFDTFFIPEGKSVSDYAEYSVIPYQINRPNIFTSLKTITIKKIDEVKRMRISERTKIFDDKNHTSAPSDASKNDLNDYECIACRSYYDSKCNLGYQCLDHGEFVKRA